MREPVDVLIVGGGIAGLATAYELHRRGVPFRVLERAGRPGGVILSEHVDGFTFDAGPDALLIQKPAAITLCQELGLGDRLFPTTEPRAAFILRGRHAAPAARELGARHPAQRERAGRDAALLGGRQGCGWRAELFIARADATARRTSRSRRSSAAGSGRRRSPTSPSRCSRASTRVT